MHGMGVGVFEVARNMGTSVQLPLFKFLNCDRPSDVKIDFPRSKRLEFTHIAFMAHRQDSLSLGCISVDVAGLVGRSYFVEAFI
jgi:hypothetical protein